VLLKAIPAVALIALSLLLWEAWVKPTLSVDTAAIAPPAEAQSLNGLHLKGKRTAQVGLIVFSDFECPACRTFARDVLPVIIDTYVATEQVLLAFSDLPLESIHPAAFRRATIAECASRQGRFWEVHDRLFSEQTSPSVELDISATLDRSKLQVCLVSDSAAIVRTRQAKAKALGIAATPSLFVGRIQGDRLKVTDSLVGPVAVKRLSAILDRRLKG
jgi:protein-disulfide isomerase